MYTSRKIRRVLQDMSDGDFTILLDDLDAQARGVVVDGSGRTAQAVALTRHYEEERSLRDLVDLIRGIMPNVAF